MNRIFHILFAMVLCSSCFGTDMISGEKKTTLQEYPDNFVKAGITVLEGTLKELSAIPDPSKSDYPDCRFTALLEGNAIIDGVRCPRKIQLVIDGFKSYKLLETAKLKPDDKIRCTVIPFEKLPDEKKTVQQADDLNLFELQSYYVLKVEKVPRFSANPTIPFSDGAGYVSVFERRINPPLPDDAIKMQRLAIKDSLAQINKILGPYNDETVLKKIKTDFAEAWEAEKSKDRPGFNRIRGVVNGVETNLVWRNIDNSFWALPEHYQLIVPEYRILTKQNLDALLAFQEFLNANGCQLIIGVVPDFYAISARVINSRFRNVPDFSSAWLIRQMLNNNLEAVYVSDRLLKEYKRYQFAFFYPDNAHPSDTAQDVMTDIFAERLRRYGFPKTLEKNRFSTDAFPHVYSHRGGSVKEKKYMFPSNCDIGSNQVGSSFLCRRVLYDGKEVFADPQSPILILGNSFIQTPMNYPDSFPSLLSSKMHMGIAYNRVAAYGPITSIITRFFNHPERFITGKRVVIIMMGIEHFLGKVRVSDIRIMDRQMLMMLSQKKLGETISACGNEVNIPVCFQQLQPDACISIPASNTYLVIDKTSGSYKNATFRIPVCALDKVQLKINGKVFPVSPAYNIYSWHNILYQNDVERLIIELNGKSGTKVVLGNIQVFR